MSDRVFFDTNVLVYCFDQKDERKCRTAHSLVLEQGAMERGVISYQVQQEFVSVTIRRLNDPVNVLRMLAGFEQLYFGLQLVHSSEVVLNRAIELWENHSFSWYDTLIVAAALQARCAILYSEDMQDGLEFVGLRIVIPFLAYLTRLEVSPAASDPESDSWLATRRSSR